MEYFPLTIVIAIQLAFELVTHGTQFIQIGMIIVVGIAVSVINFGHSSGPCRDLAPFDQA
jgi:hypothetical protein